MRKLLLITFWITSQVFAQDKQHQAELDKNEVPMEFVQLGERGLIIKTGNARFPGKRDYNLFYYTAKGDLLWQKTFKSNTQALQTDHITVASPDGSMVYHIELDRFRQHKQHLTQINRKGAVKELEIDKKVEMGENLISVFCDESYLYYLTSENGNELSNKKKMKEKLILNRFSHTDWSYKKTVLAMPSLVDGKFSTFWTFAGQWGKVKYLLSKTMNTEVRQQQFALAMIDRDGNILGKIDLDFDTGNEWVRPAVSIGMNESQFLHNGYINLLDINFSEGGYISSPATPNSSLHTPPSMRSGSLGYLQLDAANEAVYIYGLLGPRPFRKVVPGYTGFYIYKFGLDGKVLWKRLNAATQELLDEKFYTIHGLPHNRNISLFVREDQKSTFSISFYRNMSAKKRIYLFDMDEKGQVEGTRVNGEDESGEWDSSLTPTLSVRTKDYLNKKMKGNEKNVTSYTFLNKEGELLLLMDEKNRKMNVLYFKI
jgi:hypothetical protein